MLVRVITLSISLLCIVNIGYAETHYWDTTLASSKWLPFLKLENPSDEQVIINKISKGIYLDAYAGSLRGAAGTALAGSGNSVDQSILLQTLLAASDIESRVVRAKLPENQAKRLYNQFIASFQRRKSALRDSMSYDGQAVEQEIPQEYREFVKAKRDEQLRLMERLYSATETTLVKALPGLNAPAEENLAQLKQQIISELSDHAWVQVNRNGSWFDIDPTADWLSPGERLSDEFKVVDRMALPEDWLHRIKFSVKAEFVQQGENRQKELISIHGTAPAFIGAPLMLVHPMDKTWFKSIGGFAETNTRAMDVISGKRFGGIPFSPVVLIGEEEFIGDSLSIEGWKPVEFFAAPPPPELLREWICFELTGPGYKKTICRSILDRRETYQAGAYANIEFSGQVGPQGLSGIQTFAIIGGDLPEQYITNRFKWKRISDFNQTDEKLAEDELESDVEAPTIENLEDLRLAIGAASEGLFFMENRMRAAWRGGSMFGSVTEPNIYSFHVRVLEDGSIENSDTVEESRFGSRSIDVMNSKIRVPGNGDLWKEALLLSALETTNLAFLNSLDPGSTDTLFSAVLHVERTAFEEMQLLKKGDDLSNLDIPQPYRDYISKQLEDGYVLTPKKPWRHFHSALFIDSSVKSISDAVFDLTLWPASNPGNAAMTEYHKTTGEKAAEGRGVMRMSKQMGRSFCRMVQCAKATMSLVNNGIKVWGSASFIYAKQVVDDARDWADDCRRVRLRVKVPQKYLTKRDGKWAIKKKYEGSFADKRKAFSKKPKVATGPNYDRHRKKKPESAIKPADRAKKPAGTDWDHTLELRCGGKHGESNVKPVASDLNRWFGATVGAMCGMLCNGSEITGIDFYHVKGKGGLLK